MSIKKIMLLASMAVAAAVCALPAMALAAEETVDTPAFITHNGAQITTDPTLNFTGTNIRFEALGSGIKCTVHTGITVNEGVVKVTKFEITTSTCEFFGNPYKNCKFEATAGDTVTNLPWTVNVVTRHHIEQPGGTILSTTDILTVTNGPGNSEARIDGKIETKETTACFTTQNDLRILHQPANGLGVSIKATTSGTNKITGGEIEGSIKVVNALGESTAAARGLFTIEASQSNTYTFS